jgi:thiol-disulfide isomerase/thioredoxin
MKPLLVAITLVGLFAAIGRAEPPKALQHKAKPVASLTVGDLAPPLTADQWFQGKPVRKFAPGRVYVVEFWATWCGSCIAFMPDLAELQMRYRDQGVRCISFTARDANNTREQVAAFIRKRGGKLNHTFVYADDRTTYNAWMKAAGRDAIPCAFVVDRTGRVAYIGNPMYVALVLPKVVAGNRNARAVSDEIAKIDQEFRTASAALFPDTRAGLQAIKEFEAKYPPLANNLIMVRVKLSLLPKVGEIDEAKKVAEVVMARAIKQGHPSSLIQVAALLRNGPGKDSKELLKVAVKAAEAAVQVAGDGDARTLMELAETYSAIGDKARAKEYARKAVEAARGTALRQNIEQQAKRLQDEERQDKK